MYWFGNLLDRSGEYKRAEATLHEAAHAAGESRDGLLAAKAIARLVMVVGYQQARDEEGLSLGRAAEVMLGVAGGDETIRAILLNNLGIVLDVKGEHGKALEYYRKSLAIREKVLGPEHPDVAQSLNNMGEVFRGTSEYDKALEYYRKSLAIREKVLGPLHPRVAWPLHNMGIVFDKTGEYDKALEYYRKALAIKEKALGPEHPIVASSLDGMGGVFRTQGKYDKALEHYRRALAILEKVLGPEHPNVAEVLSGKGIVFVDQSRPKQALEPLERAVSICEKKRCNPEPHGRGLFALARALAATNGDTERAIRLAAEARGVFGKAPYLKKDLEEVNAWLKERGAE